MGIPGHVYEELPNQNEGGVRKSGAIASADKGRGPVLWYETQVDGFFLEERGKSRPVTPTWSNGELRIGCTAITKEAFEKLREFEP